MDLHGTVALVTGGAHRLGKAIALELARSGAHVAIHYHRSEDQAQATLAEIQALGVAAHAIAADLSEVAEAERVADEAIAWRGRLDVLVNSAGIWGPDPIGEMTQERFDQLIGVNVRGGLFLAQRAAGALRQARGAIVNIADVGAIRPWKNYTPYLISKGAVITMTEALAKDMAPLIRVNAVAPGPVLMAEGLSEEQRERTAKTVLLKRIGAPEDVARAVVYLASADYVTGVVLPVDGGQRLI